MKRSRPLWPFMCIAALIVILGVGGFFLLSPQTGGGAGSFPQWEEAAALEEAAYPTALAYGGIDTSRAGTDGMDRVLVTLEPHQPYLEGGNYRVDYRQGDSWYTVYATQFQNTLGVWLASALEDATLEYRVPAGLFSVTGEYRLVVEDMGVCEFTLEEPTGSAVATDQVSPAALFAQWREAEERDTDPRVKITFDGIETGIDLGDAVKDQVNVTLHRGTDGPYTGGDGHIIEYQFKGAWYTVYDATVYGGRSRYLGEEPEVSMKYLVPAGLFQITGTYRIYVWNLGYCEFTVEEPLGSAVSRAAEPEKESSASVVYEYDATTGKATAVPAEQYGGDAAPTVSQPEGDIEMKFPQWEEAAALPSTQEGVRFSFDRIGPTGDDESSQTDSVYLTLEKPGDTTCGPNYWVDFLYEDTWYTVYDANIQAEYTQVIGGGAGALPVEYTVPRGLFQVAGSYRLCVDSLGYCEFSIDEPLSYIEPTVSQPEGESSASVVYEYDATTGKATAVPAEQYGDGVASVPSQAAEL